MHNDEDLGVIAIILIMIAVSVVSFLYLTSEEHAREKIEYCKNNQR